MIHFSCRVSKSGIVVPKSVSEDRISSNKNIVKLLLEDIVTLDSLAAISKARRVNTPLWGWEVTFRPSFKNHRAAFRSF